MPKKDGPNVRQRRVARTLRKWRTDRGMKQEQVTTPLTWSDSKLSRLERAELIAGPAEIIALATIMGVSEDERDRTVRLAVSATNSQDEWGTYGPDSLRGDFKDFIEDESDAIEVRTVETVLITGLLQTAAYAEALLGVRRAEIASEVIAERSSLRQKRQARLDDPHEPLRLHTILHEPSLTLPIGGREVMAAQLDHLVQRGKQDNITVQVLPSSLGAFPGIGTAYHLIQFEEDVPGAAYLEGLQDGSYIEDEDELAAYSLGFERLREHALDPEESARRIMEIMRAWR